MSHLQNISLASRGLTPARPPKFGNSRVLRAPREYRRICENIERGNLAELGSRESPVFGGRAGARPREAKEP
eukprot:1190992-Prorocentrum_minimum.AAC.3